jgi:hypothetical protein
MPRRVPVPSLRPAIDLCKPTGVTSGQRSRVVVMLDRGGVGKALVRRLEKLGATALTLEPGIATDALRGATPGLAGRRAGSGRLLAAGAGRGGGHRGDEPGGVARTNRVRVKNLYTAMRTLYDSVRGPNTFLVSATRLGGLHGYGSGGATAPLGGAVSGFTKAYNMEQALRADDTGKGITVKVVDFELSAARRPSRPMR